MITRALHDSGLHLFGSGAEELIDAAEDNPEGFWENKAIVACNDELLEATGGSWDNPPDLPPLAVDDPRVLHVAASASSVLMTLGEHDHWGFKDPRTCLTAAYWLDLQPDLRFVICVRHPLEVALSLKRRNQNSYSLGLTLWERYYATALELIPAGRRIVTHYESFFIDPQIELERLCAFVGLSAAAPRVRTDLRHHTIQVGLVDAGASPSLRALYAELCREAGVALAPEPAADEGRVRRLILDGAVAERHAEQRQDAIERLQERERELRADVAAREADVRTERNVREAELVRRVRELEQQIQRERIASENQHRQKIRDLEDLVARTREAATARVESLQAETMKTMQILSESLDRTGATVANIDARTRSTASRLDVVVRATEAGPIRRRLRASGGRAARGGRRFVLRPGKKVVDRGRRAAVPAASAVADQLPAPAKFQLRRARNILQRGMAEPGPTVKAVGRKALPKARAAARSVSGRLPPPAQKTLQQSQIRARHAAADPKSAAKRVARRLPKPARQLARRTWRATERLQSRGATGGGEQALARPAPEPAPRPAPTPKGPAPRQWKDAYARMVAAALPAGASWLVVMPGSPSEVGQVAPRSTTFPHTRQGRPFADDLAHIAHLEALRFAGHRYLVLPEGSRPWFRQQAELRDHVARTYRTVVDEEGAGAVFDMAQAAGEGSRSLRGEVNGLAAGAVHIPAVLDWTSLDVAGELVGFATFRSPDDLRLPYLDHSVDVVVVDEGHDLAEASRVAALGVIVVAAGSSGVEVRRVEKGLQTGVERTGGTSPAPARVLVWAGTGSDENWRTQLAARAAASGADLHVGDIDADMPSAFGDHDVVVVVEPNVLPLPGVIEAAAGLAAADPTTAIAGKIMRADGRLEGAGGTVFADRSLGLIAESSADVRAPWHDFVRPVCWAPGLVAAASSLWTDVAGSPMLSGRPFVREWCAGVWARGASVMYQPTIVAVRVAGEGGEASVPLAESAWQRVLDLRPARPSELSDGVWRYLIARDDVEVCRG